jgi:glycosyltransferase involved in cell wall biosynthesis
MILHICNDFLGSKVYNKLYSKLDELGFSQLIFHPLRDHNKIEKNSLKFQVNDSRIIFSHPLKKHHQFLFKSKIRFLKKEIDKVDLSKVKISYPTTLFSDGVLALSLFKEKKIPYIVAVRNTDVNIYLKYRPDLIELGIEVLKKSKKIIFISEALKTKFINHPKIAKYKSEIQSKIIVIPNGIDDYWLNNIQRENKVNENKFLYVGKFDKNKNTISVIKALELLRKKIPDIQLNLVGGSGKKHDEIKKYIENLSWCKYYGEILNKSELINIFRSNKYFIMPSFYETFGLVYIEALSQGLPIIYTKNQGVDGFFDFQVGEYTSPSIDCIYISCNDIINKSAMNKYNLNEIDFELFNWKNIAKTYKGIINEIE